MPSSERVSTTTFGDQGWVAAVEVESEGVVAVFPLCGRGGEGVGEEGRGRGWGVRK